jgi:hypothetical protein
VTGFSGDSVGELGRRYAANEDTEEFMFETPQEVKPSASKGLRIGILVMAVACAVGVYFLTQRSATNKQASAAAAQVKGDADPVRDLKIQRATMSKDRNGTMAVWAVTVENKSAGYGYSNIKYETTYIGADDKVLMVNRGTIAGTIGPGEQKSVQANDPLYPAGTARYRMKITGATPATP